MPLRDRLRHLGAGRVHYNLVHRPFGAARASLREGGPIEQWRTARGRRAMEAAARHLPIIAAGDTRQPPLEMHFLTGRRFWYQTAFCLWTFAQHSRREIRPIIHDDGSLTPEFVAPLARIAPTARFVSVAETIERLDVHLPTARFPTLRERWQHFPLLRKLTDVHVGERGWKLFLDSDLLFFREPQLLIRWLDHPDTPLRAVDVENAYGYPLAMLNELAGRAVPEFVNTGLCGLRSDEIDWEKMEWWCRTLIARAGTHYYQEQALVALLLAGRTCTVAPLSDYVTLPQPPEVRTCAAVMHHYVAGSKSWYFRHNWKHALASASSTA